MAPFAGSVAPDDTMHIPAGTDRFASGVAVLVRLKVPFTTFTCSSVTSIFGSVPSNQRWMVSSRTDGERSGIWLARGAKLSRMSESNVGEKVNSEPAFVFW